MAARSILVQGGTVVSEEGAAALDLAIQGGKVLGQALPGSYAKGEFENVLDASGLLVLPGLVDPHVHLDAPFMGSRTVHDFSTGTASAAHGGVTTVISFTTQPKGGSLMENLAAQEERADGAAHIDWSLHGILLDAGEQTLAEIPRLVEAGIPTYKCFTTYRHADRMMDDDGMLIVLRHTSASGGMLMVHCENDAIIEYRLRKELELGHFDPIYHARSRPPSAEHVAARRVIDLMKEERAPVYIVHASTAETLALVRQAQDQGQPVHCETCTHYLALTESSLTGDNGQLYICSPPLRTPDHLEALWQGARGGPIEVVSSDDAGLPTEDRVRLSEGRFDRVPNGMPGIEPRLSILFSEGVAQGRISLSRLVALTSTNPARLFGLFPAKGHLAPGADADIVLFDPSVEWVMSADSLHMNTDFCPFEGRRVRGKVRSVLSRGEFVVRDGQLVGLPTHGRRVMRHLDSAYLG